ncbi:MAG TPA: hypothetical protein VJ623_08440 [Holophagaceae bacterium]|nr:hypothetical protein [Holophagaceae bacterium]
MFEALKKLAGKKAPAGTPATGSAWRAPRLLAQGPFKAPVMLLDALGQATAVWRAEGAILATRFGGRGEPEEPVKLDEAPGAQVGDPLLARSPEAMIAVWTVREQGRTRILLRTLTRGLEGEPIVAHATSDEILTLQAVVDRRGDVILLWVRRASQGCFVEALSYDHQAGTWGATPTRLDGPLGQPTPLGLVPEPKGSALAVWNHLGDGFEGLVASHYFGKERIWSDRPVGITHAVARSLDLASDDLGNAVLLYLTGDGDRVALDACVLSAATHTWHGPSRLAAAQDVSQPKAAMAKGGAALAVWRQTETNGVTRLFARTFQSGKWAARPEPLEGDMGTGRAHAFALSPEARGAVIWAQPTPGATGGAEGTFLRTFALGKWTPSAMPLGNPSKWAHHGLCVDVRGEHIAALWLAGVGRCGLMGVVGK